MKQYCYETRARDCKYESFWRKLVVKLHRQWHLAFSLDKKHVPECTTNKASARTSFWMGYYLENSMKECGAVWPTVKVASQSRKAVLRRCAYILIMCKCSRIICNCLPVHMLRLKCVKLYWGCIDDNRYRVLGFLSVQPWRQEADNDSEEMNVDKLTFRHVGAAWAMKGKE